MRSEIEKMVHVLVNYDWGRIIKNDKKITPKKLPDELFSAPIFWFIVDHKAPMDLSNSHTQGTTPLETHCGVVEFYNNEDLM